MGFLSRSFCGGGGGGAGAAIFFAFLFWKGQEGVRDFGSLFQLKCVKAPVWVSVRYAQKTKQTYAPPPVRETVKKALKRI